MINEETVKTKIYDNIYWLKLECQKFIDSCDYHDDWDIIQDRLQDVLQEARRLINGEVNE